MTQAAEDRGDAGRLLEAAQEAERPPEPGLVRPGDRPLDFAHGRGRALLAPEALERVRVRKGGAEIRRGNVGLVRPGGAGPGLLLAAEFLPRVPGDRRGDVVEQLREPDPAVAVAVGRAFDAFQEVVGE